MRFNRLENNCSRPTSTGRCLRYGQSTLKKACIVQELSKHLRTKTENVVSRTFRAAVFSSQGSPVPDGLSPEEAEEWSRMMEDPVVHDLFYGMGSSGVSVEKPESVPDNLSASQIADIMKMGSWRLGRSVVPQIELLVSQIEMMWREHLSDLKPSNIPERYAYVDTLDPTGERQMMHNVEDPPVESNAYPRMQIENRVYESFCFRKLHLEVAVKQDGLQVLHCVMYPRVSFDLPILSLDLVAYKGRPSLAVIDPCPVSSNLALPSLYANSVNSLQERYSVKTNRAIPDWGKEIFSPLCVLMRPTNPEDVGKFMKYCLALADFHIQFAKLSTPVGKNSRLTGDQIKRKLCEIQKAHYKFSAKQLENDRTRNVLEKAFGKDMSDDYMENFMFDVENARGLH